MIKISKASIITLITLLFGLFLCCFIIAFFVSEKDIQRWMLFATFFFGFGSIVVSISALVISIKSYINTENEKRKTARQAANNFLIEYDDEIDLINLCLIANEYNSVHKYNRKIYNEFNKLDVAVQKEICSLLNISFEKPRGNWVDNSLSEVRKFITEYELGQFDLLCDNGKYYKSMLKMKDVKYDVKEEFGHYFPDFSPLAKINSITDAAVTFENISFFDYTRQYVGAKIRNSPTLISYKNMKPIDYYCELIGIPIVFTYNKIALAAVNVVDTVISILKEKYESLNEDVNLLSTPDNHIDYYEDRFLQSLLELYNLSKYKIKE